MRGFSIFRKCNNTNEKKTIFKGGGHVRTSLTGVEVGVDVSGMEKVWRMFQAIGDIAFAYAFSNVLIEIQASNIYLFYLLIKFLFPKVVCNLIKFDWINRSWTLCFEFCFYRCGYLEKTLFQYNYNIRNFIRCSTKKKNIIEKNLIYFITIGTTKNAVKRFDVWWNLKSVVFSISIKVEMCAWIKFGSISYELN